MCKLSCEVASDCQAVVRMPLDREVSGRLITALGGPAGMPYTHTRDGPCSKVSPRLAPVAVVQHQRLHKEWSDPSAFQGHPSSISSYGRGVGGQEWSCGGY